jgi:RNA polymerase sigma-70 factor (ECF subfamily)
MPTEMNAAALPIEHLGLVPDGELARDAQASDRAATKKVLQLVAPGVLASVRSVVGATHPDLEDLVQEALIAVVRALPTFRGESSLLHFAKQIAVRRAIDGLRGTIRERRNRDSLPPVSESTTPPTLLERRQRLWRELLAELPPAQAEVLALRAIEGHSIEELAGLTGAPLETVRSRLRLAKATLRERIARDPALGDLMTEGDHDPA